jgi:hypothetical protein
MNCRNDLGSTRTPKTCDPCPTWTDPDCRSKVFYVWIIQENACDFQCLCKS